MDARDKGELPLGCHGEAGFPGRQGNEGPDDMYYTIDGVKTLSYLIHLRLLPAITKRGFPVVEGRWEESSAE